ncbi:hypothetical protein E2C01_083270 [Portunus trituberculatus]|uniref:Uncharacterized protein n=1 Tax=Portunus trituberculatus TaxID=210409 RepID=A0A5B7J1A7_PORTR|nr:hypothetical protein [Portunus trituberculatus]
MPKGAARLVMPAGWRAARLQLATLQASIRGNSGMKYVYSAGVEELSGAVLIRTSSQDTCTPHALHFSRHFLLGHRPARTQDEECLPCPRHIISLPDTAH